MTGVRVLGEKGEGERSGTSIDQEFTFWYPKVGPLYLTGFVRSRWSTGVRPRQGRRRRRERSVTVGGTKSSEATVGQGKGPLSDRDDTYLRPPGVEGLVGEERGPRLVSRNPS